MQYVFLLLIVLTTTQAFMLGYQDRFPIATRFEKLNQRLVRRYDSHHDPREIPETQQPRYLKISKMSHFQSFLAWKFKFFAGVKIREIEKKMNVLPPKNMFLLVKLTISFSRVFLKNSNKCIVENSPIFIVSVFGANCLKDMIWVAHIPKETKNCWITIFFGCANVPEDQVDQMIRWEPFLDFDDPTIRWDLGPLLDCNCC